jgi:hypothetical protein
VSHKKIGNTTICFLNLEGNQISSMIISQVLNTNHYLRRLNLSFNYFGLLGINPIFSALRRSSLTSLILQGVDIKDKDLLNMLLALSDKLCELDLSYNELTDESASTLGNFLRLAELRVLILNENKLGDASLLEFAAALTVNGRMEKLSILGNLFSPTGIASLERILVQNTSLWQLLVSFFFPSE